MTSDTRRVAARHNTSLEKARVKPFYTWHLLFILEFAVFQMSQKESGGALE